LFFHDELNFGLGSRELDIVVLYESSGSILGTAGILGMNAFQDETIVLDFPESELYASDDSVRRDLTIHPTLGVIRGEAHFRGFEDPIPVMIDTGSPFTVVNTALGGTRRART
jgi:hypothetical protein